MNSRQIPEYTTFPRQFLAYRWYKPLLVGVLTFVFMVVFLIAILSLGAAWSALEGGSAGGLDSLDSLVNMGDAKTFTGPGMLAAFGGVAVILPALALATLIVRDRPFSSYSSSRGGFNWSAFFKCLGVAAVVYGAFTAFELVVYPDENATGVIAFTVGGFVLSLILVPLQCAAEEYAFRGLMLQAISSWTKLPAVGIAVTSLIFAAAHEYNIDGMASIFIGAIVWGIVVWQTKGLEATCAAHIMNNMMGVYTVGFGVSTLADATSEVDIAGLVIAIAIDVVYAAAVIFLSKKFNWFTPKDNGVAQANEGYLAAKARKQRAVPSPSSNPPSSPFSNPPSNLPSNFPSNPPSFGQPAPYPPAQGEAPLPPQWAQGGPLQDRRPVYHVPDEASGKAGTIADPGSPASFTNPPTRPS